MFPIRDNIPSERRPFMMWLIIAANAAVFLGQLTLPRDAHDTFVTTYGLVPAGLTDPAIARDAGVPGLGFLPVFTSMFLHGSLLHIFANMWMLWIFGDNVEDRMGPVRFLVFYLLCGVGAAAAQWLSAPDSTIPMIGASGAIAGVLGGYFLLYPTARILMVVPIFFYPIFFAIPAFFFAVYWFFVQVVSGAASLGLSGQGGVAWWAHVGGFVAGLALVRLFATRRPRPSFRGPRDGLWVRRPPRGY